MHGPVDNNRQFAVRIGLQQHDPRPGQERRNHFKGGIFRSRTNECNEAFFDMGQKGILLCLVESVDFIYEEDRFLAVVAPLGLRLINNSPDFFDARKDSGETHKMGFCFMGDDTGQSGLSRAGRSPEDHRKKPIFFNGSPKKAAQAQEV